MSRVTEKFLDLLHEQQLSAPSWTVATIRIDDVVDEMTIIPEGEHGPMLRIAAKTKDGSVLHTREMNLSAVDGMIGKLIKMRDLMAKLKDGGASE
jgi:Mg/Co/Ni transporter MgtE